MTRTIKLIGHDKDIETIVTMLRHMEYLGEVGASRNILVRVDGDGSGRIHVFNEDGSRIDNNKYNIEQNIEGPLVAVYDIGCFDYEVYRRSSTGKQLGLFN